MLGAVGPAELLLYIAPTHHTVSAPKACKKRCHPMIIRLNNKTKKTANTCAGRIGSMTVVYTGTAVLVYSENNGDQAQGSLKAVN